MKPSSKILLILLISLLVSVAANAQPCTGGTPSYNIDFTGSNDSIWNSPSLTRAGNCCGDNNCIEFNVTLDTNSNGLKLEIISGSTPGGSLNYQIACAGSNNFGSAVCLTGTGPHRLTFCKPGGNSNTYRITALPKPVITGRLNASSSCPALMKVSGFAASGLAWSSVPNNTTHNSYLSCSSGCDSVGVTPTGSITYPLNLTYKVCGTLSNACGSATTCDTVDLLFVSNHSVSISPNAPAVCAGSSTTTLTANVSSGLSPFTYSWSNSSTSTSINVGTGTYHVAVSDAVGCSVARDTVVVASAAKPTPTVSGTVDPCSNSSYTYSTPMISGNRYLWTCSGTILGTDTSSDVSILWGSSGPGAVQVKQTNTYGCDSTRASGVTIRPLPSPSISGNTSPCATKPDVYSVSPVSGHTYLWSVNGGTITGANTGNSVNVSWGQAGSGTLNVIQSSNFGCNYTGVKNISILPVPSGCTLYHY